MNKLLQLAQAIGCFYEMETGQKSLKGLQWLEAIFEFWIGGFLFFILLAVSICIGDATIPTYLGDGYSYDNFPRTAQWQLSRTKQWNERKKCHLETDK